ncbi:MAG: hypothetical protein EPN26_08215 [Rhodospirillales bacterium]|nr:MAG: hypothetical protein EPN26_08215 [Rhodospirillales bacterium]
MTAMSAVKMISSHAQASQQAKYQSAVMAQQQAQQQAVAQAQVAQLQASRDAEAENRKRQLKAEMASRKAAFGAMGVDSAAGGSAGAVLKGLVTRAEEDQATDDKMYGMKASAIGQSLDFANQRNLLEQSRQFSSGASLGLDLLQKGLGMAGSLLKSR